MNEEIKNENSAEELCSPLVVHKKSDASYSETASKIDVNETHESDDGPTLRRHRFRKDKSKNSNKALVVIMVLIAVLVGVFCALYFTGNISFKKQIQTTTKPAVAQETTSVEEKYADTIVIKCTYIFVDGIEVDGIEGLQDALEYEDRSTTAYSIINENADDHFINYEILPLLSDMGFYDEKTIITRQGYTGLISKSEAPQE